MKLLLFITAVVAFALALLPSRATADSYTQFPHLARCERNLAQQIAVKGLDPKWESAQPLSSAVIPSFGYATTDMAKAIDPIVGDYMNGYGLPGGAVAMTYKGKLIFAKSYGYMDVHGAWFAQPDTRFRMASVTKPFTAMAILKLVHDGRLSLSDHPFPFSKVGRIIGGTSGHYFMGGSYNSELSEITVNDLLHHAGGWNRDAGPDLTGYSVLQSLTTFLSGVRHVPSGPPNCTTLLSFVESQPLQFKPGTRVDYSNIGFCALSEVVREKGGPTYYDYLADNVLKPLGLNDTTLGSTEQSKRQDREAFYYNLTNGPAASLFPPYNTVPPPYSTIGALESLEGAGGIVSTAIDLSTLAGAIADGKLTNLTGEGWPKQYYVDSAKVPKYECTTDKQAYPASALCPPHSSKSYQAAHSTYGMGWDAVPGNAVSQPLLAYDDYNFIKDGGYPGTLSSLAVTADGYGFGAVFNGDYNNAPGPQSKIFWPHALPAAYHHANRQAWNVDFSDQYASGYTSWMMERNFKTYLAEQEKDGYYPSRLEGMFVARLHHHTVDNPENPSNSGIEYRARFARRVGDSAPKVVYGASCAAVLREIERAPASTPLVSLQRFFDTFAGGYVYQAVWSAPIPQLPTSR